MSKMSKVVKRPHPDDDDKESQILASPSASDDESCLRPKKKFRLFRKLQEEDNGSLSQSSKATVDVNENVYHEKGQKTVKQSLSRTSLFIFFENKPKPSYPWSAQQTDILRSAVESKSFHFLPRTTTDKIFKDMKKIFKREKFDKKDVFHWFLTQKDTAQVSVTRGD